jgi:hypothetical protein
MNMRVDPCCIQEHATDGSIRFAACGAAAMPFKYWSGSMKYRFQVVCSAFHRGRIAVVYDPQWIDYNPGGVEANTNYMKSSIYRTHKISPLWFLMGRREISLCTRDLWTLLKMGPILLMLILSFGLVRF